MENLGRTIVERELLFIPPKGSDFPLEPGNRGTLVKLGIVLPDDENPSVCTLCFEGFRTPIKVSGCHKWQALFLSMRKLHSILFELESSGWTFEIYEEGSEQEGEPECVVTVSDLMEGLAP